MLFDLDGVLIDSEGLYTKFWQETEALFPTGIPDFARSIKGTTIESIVLKFKPEQRDEIMRRIYEFDSHLVYPMFDGAIELLRLLKAKGVPAALVTSSNPEKMQQLFRIYPDFKGYFAAIIDGAMVSHGKPDPECYLLAARSLGVDPRSCIVVEDSIQGMRAGRAAGATVYGLSTTLGLDAVMGEADRVFANINEVRKSFS